MKKFENPEVQILVLVTEEVAALSDFLSGVLALGDVGDGGWSADK